MIHAKNVKILKNFQVVHVLIVEQTKFMTLMELHVNAKIKPLPDLLINLNVQEILLPAKQIGYQKELATKNVVMMNTSKQTLVQNVPKLTKEEFLNLINLPVNALVLMLKLLVPQMVVRIVDAKMHFME